MLALREPLDGVELATVKPMQYPADGTLIPASLALPPGKDHAEGLPAVVMPPAAPRLGDHQLEDSQARTRMLRRSDAFLRQTIGL
ncbi:MAG TPA: hypothetical protein VKT22_15025 [Steroidobacteraceae bacterium]|nr:hypothetical protein [Steroidobacteraceae bacterium]